MRESGVTEDVRNVKRGYWKDTEVHRRPRPVFTTPVPEGRGVLASAIMRQQW